MPGGLIDELLRARRFNRPSNIEANQQIVADDLVEQQRRANIEAFYNAIERQFEQGALRNQQRAEELKTAQQQAALEGLPVGRIANLGGNRFTNIDPETGQYLVGGVPEIQRTQIQEPSGTPINEPDISLDRLVLMQALGQNLGLSGSSLAPTEPTLTTTKETPTGNRLPFPTGEITADTLKQLQTSPITTQSATPEYVANLRAERLFKLDLENKLEQARIQANAEILKAQAQGKPLTDFQQRTGIFASQFRAANKELTELAPLIAEKGNVNFLLQTRFTEEGFLGDVANFARSPEIQAFLTLSKQLTEAAGRFVSGAQVRLDEEGTQKRIFLPLPGDSEQVLKLKDKNRRIFQESMENVAQGGSALDIDFDTIFIDPYTGKTPRRQDLSNFAGNVGDEAFIDQAVQQGHTREEAVSFLQLKKKK